MVVVSKFELAEMRAPAVEWESLYQLAGSADNVILLGFKNPALRQYTGQTLAAVAAARHESPEDTIIDLVDNAGCDLVLTTGGTGPSARDLTPEATLAAAPREFPGFGEKMRMASLAQTPTAILSRQLAAQRGKCLVVNLPGSPRSIDLCLDSIMAAVPYCLELMGAAWIDTDPQYIQAFRPKK